MLTHIRGVKYYHSCSFLLLDKLSPDSVMASSRSEEMLF